MRAIFGLVRELDALVDRVDRRDGNDRDEELVLEQAGASQAGPSRPWGDVVAVGQSPSVRRSPPAGDCPSRFASATAFS